MIRAALTRSGPRMAATTPSTRQLGTFRGLSPAALPAAAAHGIEIALDFAIQCSPDHPWLRQHPEWFRWRPDGSLRFAENPPKKYEDIVNVEFYADGAACRNCGRRCATWSLFWIEPRRRIFRVDNPHTKPLPFWEWLIADIRARHPDTLFLSEAFTRPKMMYRLAKLGFSQSYTYFTWRNSKQRIDRIFHRTDDARRSPNISVRIFFVNTPDINPFFLQHSGRAGFLIRAVAGRDAVGPVGHLFRIRIMRGDGVAGPRGISRRRKIRDQAPRLYQAPGNIIAEIAQLNRIRKAHPALQSHLGLTFYNALQRSRAWSTARRCRPSARFDPRRRQSRSAPPARGDVRAAAVGMGHFRRWSVRSWRRPHPRAQLRLEGQAAARAARSGRACLTRSGASHRVRGTNRHEPCAWTCSSRGRRGPPVVQGRRHLSASCQIVLRFER